MKNWYSANELAGLPGMPRTASAVIRKAKRESYLTRIKGGRGRRKEYHLSSLPKETTDAISTKETVPVAINAGTVKKVEPRSGLDSLKKWQRETMDARLVLYREFERLQGIHGTTRAADMLVHMAKNETLPPHIQKMVARANARRGGNRTLSRSTILSWQRKVRRYGIAALAPKPTKKEQVPAWAPYFHKVYNRPQKPSIQEAMRELEHILPPDIAMPSYYQLRRYHMKRSRLEREKGRHSGSALKRFKGYIKRSTDNLQPLDVVQCDGHSFKAKISHPIHGRPFHPEVCAVLDVKTRLCLGWSAGLAESAHTVADALRDAMTVNDRKPWGGVPAILYTDKGAGNMAHMLTDEVTGILARAGITHHTGIPGNAQGRGLIEKSNQKLWISAARKLATFTGRGMDKLEERRVYLLMEKEVNKTGTCTASELPSWSQFIEFCDQAMRDYNNTPHAGLGKIRDQGGLIRHLTPFEAWHKEIRQGWEPTLLDPEILADLFRPQITRTTERGQVRLFGNVYFDTILEHYHGEKVIVEYDIHDASSVRVRDIKQRLICVAKFERNKRDFFPVPEVERARGKRAEHRLLLNERKRQEILAERDGETIESEIIPAELLVEPDPGAVARQIKPQEQDIVTIKACVSDNAATKEEEQEPVRIFTTKSDRFVAMLDDLRESPRPLTMEECAFLDEYYQEEGGRMYLKMVGDLRLEYGVAGDKQATM